MEQTDLQETVFCDFNHPAVSTLAITLANGETNTRKVTTAIFNHVRDNIRFGFDVVQVKASETVTKGYGVCWNKALLMVALLRKNKISARLAYNPVKREFMRPAMGEAVETLPETINHCFAQVQLGDTWIAVDATLDAPTYRKLFVPHNVSWGIDWNDAKDLRLYTENIAGPVDFFEDIDAAIQRNVGNSISLPPPAESEAFFGPVNQQMWRAVTG